MLLQIDQGSRLEWEKAQPEAGVSADTVLHPFPFPGYLTMCIGSKYFTDYI